LAVLAIAQMGVHLVFFLHITTGPDSSHNVLALAFGVLIVFLVLAGSLVIMANLNENMMAHTELMNLQMQHSPEGHRTCVTRLELDHAIPGPRPRPGPAERSRPRLGCPLYP